VGFSDDGEVVNDLIDDNPIEEDDSEDESDGSGGRKRKKSDDEDELSDRLEDDDYDLIEENLGVKVQRVCVPCFSSIQLHTPILNYYLGFFD